MFTATKTHGNMMTAERTQNMNLSTFGRMAKKAPSISPMSLKSSENISATMFGLASSIEKDNNTPQVILAMFLLCGVGIVNNPDILQEYSRSQARSLWRRQP